MPDHPRVKICGLGRLGDVEHAVEAGADYVGFVLSEGFGRSVRPEAVAEWATPAGVGRVAVLVDETPEDAARIAEQVGATVVQLHGGESPEDVARLAALGPWELWKAARVREASGLRATLGAYSNVDGFLLEGWKEGKVGGAGMRLMVEPSAVRGSLPSGRTFVLAGGLTPGNVREAIRRFGPDVVDVSSGVEKVVGEKEPESIVRFIAAAKRERPQS